MRERTVLTTGANSGIGLATVLEVGRRGFRSVGTVRSQAKARAVRQAAAAAGVTVETALLDVTNAEQCRRVIDRFRPWGLVSNAGSPMVAAIEDVEDDDAQALLETMVVAPMRLARLALPHMRREGSGRIINMSSIYGRISTPLNGWYQGAKHALEALSDALRMELASSGIAVVLIEPGGFRTELWDDAERQMAERRHSNYERAYQRTMQGIRLSMPLLASPAGVAGVIARALTVRNPRPRYLVGYDAQLANLVDRAVPTRIKDRVMRLTLGL
ncbi:MAG: SDR family NAD(P)-dependent oxidoreductase [Actinomycetota bacterium]|nr:SDR family NAD(P)-dependent oxidoreductase [Actinomycetota bacterium]